MLIDLSKIINSLSKILIDKNLKLSLCESCTGGLLSKIFTDSSGSSLWFSGSFVTYGNDLKEIIGVNKSTLELYGAVSREVALEMSEAALKLANSDVCLSITGIAGPKGGTKKKPVGLVYIGIRVGKKVFINKCNFKNNGRNFIQKQTVKKSINLLIKLIK